MILVVDSSSTKTEWCICENGTMIFHHFTDGINPYFQNRREISRCIRLNLPDFYFKKKFDKVYYYGAGCNTIEKINILNASLVAQFKTKVVVESDLLGAARGLFSHDEGLACILGTGSNSCHFDGEKIVKNIRPGGFILGDEGSAAVLGKMFISDILKEICPTYISNAFFDKFKISINELMDSVYNKPLPNRFLSTFTFFIEEFMSDEYVYSLMSENFRNFFKRNVLLYDYQNIPIRFVGGMAWNFSKLLQEVAGDYGITIDRIDENSMNGLIAYHYKDSYLVL